MTDTGPLSDDSTHWAAVAAQFRQAATTRLDGVPDEHNFPEIDELLKSAQPTPGSLQSTIDDALKLTAPPDVGDEVSRDYRELVASVAQDWQQLLNTAMGASATVEQAAMPSLGEQTIPESAAHASPTRRRSGSRRRVSDRPIEPTPVRTNQRPHTAEAVAWVVGAVAVVIGAQSFGVFGWLSLGIGIYVAGASLLTWGLRRSSVPKPLMEVLSFGIPAVVVGIAGFVVRSQIHPGFSWSNLLVFFFQ